MAVRFFFNTLSTTIVLLYLLSYASLPTGTTSIPTNTQFSSIRLGLFDGEGLSDILSSLFGGKSRGKRGSRKRRERGDGHGGAGKVLEAVSGRAKSTFILLHGVDDKASRYASAFKMFQGLLPSTRFIFPQAETEKLSYLKKDAASWYDITGRRKDEPIVDEDELMKAVERLDKIIEGEIDKGIKSEKIIIGGLSQGGSVALTAYMKSKRRIGGCVGVSTWMPLRDQYPKEAEDGGKDAKVLLIHGTDDKVLDYELAEKTKEALEENDRSVRLVSMKGEDHLLSGKLPKVGALIVSFIKQNT